MGRVSPRWTAVLLAVAVALPAIALAQDEVQYRPPRSTLCWSCHQAPVGASPPLVQFFSIVPPAEASGAVGEKFEYVVQVQNAWSSDLLYLEPTLDISNAPSIAFASDLPDLALEIPDVLTVAPDPTVPQRQATAAEVPVGYTSVRVELRPNDPSPITGPDLTLKVYSPGADPATAQPVKASAEAGRGTTKTVDFPTRADVAAVGYGNWTLVAETMLANASLPPRPGQQEGYTLVVNGKAEAIEDRVLSVPLGGKVPKGGATSVRFVLVSVAVPADPSTETVKLSANAWVHYNHKSNANPDDDNTTQGFEGEIKVEAGAGGAALRSPQDPDSVIVVPGVQNGATLATLSEAVGYAAAFLLVASVWTGGMFGKASRRQLNTVFGSAKRRVAFHNFLSYGILLAASVHTVLFIVEQAYYWTLGLVWGGLAILSMFGLGLTGAFQVHMIRRWSYGVWRWTHYGMAVAAILFSVAHGLLDGVHFDEVQNAVGWKDPLDPRDVAV